MLPLLIDCDGVVADYVGGVLLNVEHATNMRYLRTAVDQYNLWEAIGMTGVDKNLIIKNYITKPGWCQNLLPLPGAVEGVRELNKIRRVVFLTSLWNSSPTWVYDRNKWLRKHFGRDLGSRVIFTNSGDLKRHVRGAVLVDDKAINCEGWAESNPEGRPFLWPAPYNPGSRWTWNDVMEYARGL